jgi:hypothetical protein
MTGIMRLHRREDKNLEKFMKLSLDDKLPVSERKIYGMTVSSYILLEQVY